MQLGKEDQQLVLLFDNSLLERNNNAEVTKKDGPREKASSFEVRAKIERIFTIRTKDERMKENYAEMTPKRCVCYYFISIR